MYASLQNIRKTHFDKINLVLNYYYLLEPSITNCCCWLSIISNADRQHCFLQRSGCYSNSELQNSSNEEFCSLLFGFSDAKIQQCKDMWYLMKLLTMTFLYPYVTSDMYSANPCLNDLPTSSVSYFHFGMREL